MPDGRGQDGNGVDIELNTFESHATGTNCVADFVQLSPENTQNVEQLKKLVQSNRASVNIKNKEDGRTALHLAVLEEKAEFVDVLLEAGAEIKQDVVGNTAVQYAGLTASPKALDIFKRLLTQWEIFEKKLEFGPMHIWEEREKVEASLKQWKDAVTLVNDEGFNVLDLALKHRNRKIVEYIVRETSLQLLMHLLRNNTGRTDSSPFRGLIVEMPDIAKEVMDKCISWSENEITFHYEILDDTFILKYWPPVCHDYDDFDFWEDLMVTPDMACAKYTTSMVKIKDNHPIKLMLKGRRTDTDEGLYQQLLDHPLVKALVRHKWNHIGVKFHLLNLAFYLIYLAVLTLCVITTVPPYVHSQSQSIPFTYRNTIICQNVTLCQNETSCQNGNACKNTTLCHDTTTCLNKTTTEAAATRITCHSFESHRKSMVVDLQYFVIALSLIMILKEVYQLVRLYGREYFKQIENYVELAVYISSVLFVVNVTDCENTGYRTIWQWVLGTFSAFMAWINLLEFAKKFDRFGIYIIILWPIIKMFLVAVFPIVAVVLMAVAIAFTCVYQDQDDFADLWYSILKTTTMMISGSDFEEFLSLVDNYNLAFASYIIYSLFQFLLTILVINLMVSVAVENVKKIYKDASDINTALQFEYTLEFEVLICFISSKLRNICNIETFRIWFNLRPKEVIDLTQLVSTRLPVQQIMDLIDKNKAKDEQERMDLFEMSMTEKLNTIKKQTAELSSIKDELRSINEVLKLRSNVMTNTNK